MPQIRTWALIADGARAFILENSGDDNAWVELAHHRYGGHGDGHANGHHDGKLKFAADLATVLDKELKAHAYKQLIIAAPPAMLGDIRKDLSTSVAAAIVGEFPHDLTKTPIHEMAKHIHAIKVA